ncbi:MAG TPA: MgtC/SapB family protein [Vicinamibacterales bacterium]|nr:MgtC/SapB family protein [Acidobacteriota bacterium]HOC16854.1 MgtC/SapB family protein [Vicinamibacterales bacterium]
MNQLQQLMPREGAEILLVLFLSFLVGLEREEHKGEGDYSFGGVRTFPLIGLIGYATAMLSGGQIAPVAVGFAVVSAFMLVAYRHKIGQSSLAGATSEMSALVTYLIGALVRTGHFWVATTLGVVSLLLLELKVVLESMARRAEPAEILTFAKFLLLSAVILPALPNQPLGPFGINPFRTWLVVVAVSGLSYASYVFQRATRGRGGIVLGALLGGAYSSTVMTVVLARRAGGENRPHLFSGAMLVASGTMFLRLIALLALFNGELASRLAPSFLGLAAAAIVGGLFLARIPDPRASVPARQFVARNPLELRAALLFGALFVVMLAATDLAVTRLGSVGVYVLGAVMGVADVDPFIMSMTQAARQATPLGVAAVAVLVTVASNNLVKGVYAFLFADRRTGTLGLASLAALAAATLLPIAFF